uniref:(northern house mosquito) hypothetical protein n=1 Tax=Culex pipiens TaxID=7175 RepID=A0A8D8K6I7_CULPI
MWPSVGIRIRRRNTSPPPSSWTSAPAIPSCRTKSSDRSCRSSTWKTRTTLSASSTQGNCQTIQCVRHDPNNQTHDTAHTHSHMIRFVTWSPRSVILIVFFLFSHDVRQNHFSSTINRVSIGS